MIRRIATVGGLTLVSRVTGFVRDVVMAAVLGAGPMADAFFVAFRLPNHFRAIFAEGAFNAAFVPAYARTLEQAGSTAAKLFADRIAAALLAINIVLLALALVLHPGGVSPAGAGLDQDPERYNLAVALTRITFPYSRAGVDADIVLRRCSTPMADSPPRPARRSCSISAIVITLLLVAYCFPNAGYAAAWGVLVAGVLSVLVVGARRRDAWHRHQVPHAAARRPRTRKFLKALSGPPSSAPAACSLRCSPTR